MIAALSVPEHCLSFYFVYDGDDLCCVITQNGESSPDLLIIVTNRKALAPGRHTPTEPPFKTLITLLPVTFSQLEPQLFKLYIIFVTGNYNYETGSMTGILGQLKWESLKKRRKDNRLILLYKGLKVKPVYQQMTLSPKLGVVGISTLWHFGERGGSVVECRTPEREVRGSRPTAAVLCP